MADRNGVFQSMVDGTKAGKASSSCYIQVSRLSVRLSQAVVQAGTAHNESPSMRKICALSHFPHRQSLVLNILMFFGHRRDEIGPQEEPSFLAC